MLDDVLMYPFTQCCLIIVNVYVWCSYENGTIVSKYMYRRTNVKGRGAKVYNVVTITCFNLASKCLNKDTKLKCSKTCWRFDAKLLLLPYFI